MKEEKKTKQAKTKKRIIKIIGAVIVGGVLMVTAGCGITGKGSRSWIENEISDIEKVYPTENPEDLFEKFPNGFAIRQKRLFSEDNKRYGIILEVIGYKTTKRIEGKVSRVLLESKPSYKETVEKESKVEYKKGEGLVLEKSELTDELLPKNYFLFQKLKLNKDILKRLEVKDKSYSFETDRYNIKYLFTNKEIDNYLGLNKGGVNLDITGQYSEQDKTYFHTIVIKEDTKKTNFSEKIVEEKSGRKNEE